jgi:hypothetical protein
MIPTQKQAQRLTIETSARNLTIVIPAHPGHTQCETLVPVCGKKFVMVSQPRPPTDETSVHPFFSLRCKMKGCVFPASEPESGLCHCHNLQETEPRLFESLQPIFHVMEQAKFGSADSDFDDVHLRERRLRASLRKAFLEGGA